MVQLGTRQERVLQAVVEGFIPTGRPVGSEQALNYSGLKVSPATIRNDMARLSELEVITKPHRSAGRIPTDKGYRYYVDHLMIPAPLNQQIREWMEKEYESLEKEGESVFRGTCRLLLELTGHPSIAISPNLEECTVNYIQLMKPDAGQILLVIILDTGQVIHHLFEGVKGLQRAPIEKLNRLLRTNMVGRPLSQLSNATKQLAAQAHFSQIGMNLLDLLVKKAFDLEPEYGVHIEGQSKIFEVPEFQDMSTLEELLHLLGERTLLARSVRESAKSSAEVEVCIGRENLLPEMQRCSLVLRRFRTKGTANAFLAVIGPTRMRYAKTIPAVNGMANHLVQRLA